VKGVGTPPAGLLVSDRQRLSGGDSVQVTAGGVVENVPVAGHECSVRHARGGNDQPISWGAPSTQALVRNVAFLACYTADASQSGGVVFRLPIAANDGSRACISSAKTGGAEDARALDTRRLSWRDRRTIAET
jgi:hypothetical protein